MSRSRIALQTSVPSKAGTGCGIERPVLQAREIDRGVELTEIGERRESFRGVEIRGLELELLHQPGEHLRRQVGIVLEADRVAHPALAQTLLDLLEEISGRPAGHRLDVGVARHADRMRREDLVPVIEPRQVQPDHVLEQHEVVFTGRPRQPDEPRDHLGGDVDHRQRGAGEDRRLRGPERDHQTEGAVDEVREGMSRVDRERRHHREERPVEVRLHDLGLLGGDLLRADDPDALRDQARLDVLEEAPVLLLDQRVHALRHRRQRPGRGQPVGGGALISRPDALLQVRHADHEELVEIRAEDGQELDALEERHGQVLGLFQHAAR